MVLKEEDVSLYGPGELHDWIMKYKDRSEESDDEVDINRKPEISNDVDARRIWVYLQVLALSMTDLRDIMSWDKIRILYTDHDDKSDIREK